MKALQIPNANQFLEAPNAPGKKFITLKPRFYETKRNNL